MAIITRVGQAIFLSALLSMLLPLSSLGVQASDRFDWSNNVWGQPSLNSRWSSRWGTGISVAIGTGSPYWRNHDSMHIPSNNAWSHSRHSGWHYPYWSKSYPYRYDRGYGYYHERRALRRGRTPAKVISAPVRITTSVQYASGLKSLPENARVIQRDGRTFYEWRGVEYVFDWNTETYRTSHSR